MEARASAPLSLPPLLATVAEHITCSQPFGKGNWNALLDADSEARRRASDVLLGAPRHRLGQAAQRQVQASARAPTPAELPSPSRAQGRAKFGHSWSGDANRGAGTAGFFESLSPCRGGG